MTTGLADWTQTIVAAVPELASVKHSVENELLASAVFDAANRLRLLPDDAVFIGETALRLCHGSPRFSEGLDFHTPAFAPRRLDRDALRQELERVIGCEVAVSTPMSANRATLARISAILPDRKRTERRPRTRIDLGAGKQLDARPTIVNLKMAGGVLPGMGDVGDSFSFPVSSREELLVDKHLALVGRARRIKHRDLFDILWLHSQGVAFDADMLAAKLNPEVKASFVGVLRQRAAAGKVSIRSGEYRAEMERFLPGNSNWLFEDARRRDGMAGGFETLVLDNARSLEVALGAATVPVTRDRSG